MTGTAKALYQFFSRFGLDAYVEYSPPEDARLPYITYQVVEPDWRDSAVLYARVWYRSTSYVAINAKVDEIRRAVGEGVSIPTNGGAVYLYKGSPFAQNMPMEGDDTLKVVYLNFIIEAHVPYAEEPGPEPPEPPEPPGPPVPAVPNPDDPATLYEGQTVVDGWIVNEDGSEGVDILNYADDPQYQGARFRLTLKVNGIIDRLNGTIASGQWPIYSVFSITIGPNTYVDGTTNVESIISIPDNGVGIRIWTRGGTGIKDIVLTRIDGQA